MNHRTDQRVLSALGVGLLLASFALTGCNTQDIVTYSDKSKREGIALYQAGNYPEAAGAFRNASKQDPRDYQTYYYLGVTYDALQSYQQSIQAFRTSLDTMNLTLDGRNDRVFRYRTIDALAIATAKSNNRQVEIDAIQSRIAGKETAEDLFLIAKIHRYSGDPDSAVDFYNRAVMLDRKNFEVVKEYGLYLEAIGQPDRAQAALVQAYRLNENDAETANALRRLGVVPGVSLREESSLTQPAMPKGPLPEITLQPPDGPLPTGSR